jgi:hypothetical protein
MNSRKRITYTLLLCTIAFWSIETHVSAYQDETPSSANRELYVPFSDLDLLLESDPNRVYLTRQEYQDLKDSALEKPVESTPTNVTLQSAHYLGKLGGGRFEVEARVKFEVLNNQGPYLFNLPITGFGIQSALLDDAVAPLIKNEQGETQIVLESQGKHELVMNLVMPSIMDAAQQKIQFVLPSETATRFSIGVTGNVELLAGAAVVSRNYDSDADQTNFDLVLPNGNGDLSFTVNNRQVQENLLISAQSVLVSEVTQGYERLHATVSYRIWQGSTKDLVLKLPPGFEVTTASSPLLSRWDQQTTADERNLLRVELLERVADRLVLEITANRSPVAGRQWIEVLENWTFPRLTPLDTQSSVSVLGLVVEDRLQVRRVEKSHLLPLDARVLDQAIPQSVLIAEPGAPEIRQIAAFYAPDDEYALSAEVYRPAAEIRVASSQILLVANRGLELSGTLVISPIAEEIYEFQLQAPDGWQLDQMVAADGRGLEFEQREPVDGIARYSARLPQGVTEGSSVSIEFLMSATPEGWLEDWDRKSFDFPNLEVVGATQSGGAIVIQTADDIQVTPGDFTGLVPVLENEKVELGIAGIPSSLAYRFESQAYSLPINAVRINPVLTARTLSFLKIDPGSLSAHYAMEFNVQVAKVRELGFSLPLNTPLELQVTTYPENQVAEITRSETGEARDWTVKLQEPHLGPLTLVVKFRQPLGEDASRIQLPLAQARAASLQSGLFSVEGDPELEIAVETSARRVDVGELTSNTYAIGRRLVGAFSYLGGDMEAFARVQKRISYGLPSALIQRAELVTQVSAQGVTQSVARYQIVSKASLLEITLPNDSQLWTIFLDGEPTKPQRDGDRLLLGLSSQSSAVTRHLHVVYQTRCNPIGLIGKLELQAPIIAVRSIDDDENRIVPEADLEWTVRLPSGHRVRWSEGATDLSGSYESPWSVLKLLGFVSAALGGTQRSYIGAAADMAPMASSSVEVEDGYEVDPAALLSLDQEMTAGNEKMSQFESGSLSEESSPFGDRGILPTEPSAATESPRQPQTAAPQPSETPPVDRPNADDGEPQAETESAGRASGKDSKQLWALEGMSSLEINLNSSSDFETQFSSLGEEHRLSLGTVNLARWETMSLAAGILAVLIGLGLWNKSAKIKLRWVITLLLIGSVPLLASQSLGRVAVLFDTLFLAGFALIPLYVLLGLIVGGARFVKSIACRCCSPQQTPTMTVLLGLTLAACFTNSPVFAQESAPEVVDISRLKNLLSELEGPIVIPGDAIIVPYDPEQAIAPSPTQKLLIPLPEYRRLWEASHPGEKSSVIPFAVAYSVSHADYQVTLGSNDSLNVKGVLEIISYRDSMQVVPLELRNAVIVVATMNGQPAKLQYRNTNPAVQQQAAQVPNAAAVGGETNLDLLISGKGRHRLEFQAELGVVSQGAWRISNAQLPRAASQSFQITIPEPQTEVVQQGLADTTTYESVNANESWSTAISAAGLLNLRWRTKLNSGQVDQSLTAVSYSIFDIREDALRMTWQANLEFGRSTRDAFSFDVPGDYRIEAVVGANVRGFTTRREADRQLVDVTLLKSVQGTEQVTLTLSQKRSADAEDTQVSVPVVQIRDAALESGEVAIRRSPRLELQVALADGISRYESNATLDQLSAQADQMDAAILAPVPFQVFRFVKPPYNLDLRVQNLVSEPSIDVRSALRIGSSETTLDVVFRVNPSGVPVYQLEVLVPKELVPLRVGNESQEWTMTDSDEGNRLTIRFINGQTGMFEVPVLFQWLKAAEATDSDEVLLRVPQIRVEMCKRQTGVMMIVPEPDVEVRFGQLEDCEGTMLNQGPAWMIAQQRVLTKASLRFNSANYTAELKLVRRIPEVSARTISNVLVTSNSLEETVLVDLDIQQAGVRQISLLVPEYLIDGAINAKLLQQKTVTAVLDSNNQEVAGWVRLTLDLQDDVRGRYSLLIQKDRLLTEAGQKIELPTVEGVKANRRYVALENAGRDEILIESGSISGLEELGPQESKWKELTNLLGDSIARAFVADTTDGRSELTLETLEREQVDRAGARIGLAQTTMVVDEEGGYRAAVEFRVSNADEPFLELQLPNAAELWTVTVAGEPGKAIQGAPGQQGQVRIPLVKTAEGEGDYSVQIKYAGKINLNSKAQKTSFPLIRSNNINIELSQVRLMLPKDLQWFDFNGTMRLVDDESDLAQGFQSYLNKRIQEATQALSSGSNSYSKVRAAVNLSQSRQLLEDNRRELGRLDRNDNGVQQLFLQNDKLLEDAEEQAQIEFNQASDLSLDNRSRLNQAWREQEVERSNNVIRGYSSNFEGAYNGGKDDSGKLNYNADFFAQNQLQTNKAQNPQGQSLTEESASGESKGQLRTVDGKKDFGRKGGYEDDLKSAQINRFNAQQQIDFDVQDEQRLGQQSGVAQNKELPKLQAYRDQLERNDRFAQPQAPTGNPANPMSNLEGVVSGGLPGGFGGQMGGGANIAPPAYANQAGQGPSANTGTERFEQLWDNVDTGFASLDVTLPERGRVYRFTTPRGEMEITARAIPDNLTRRGSKLLQVIGFIVGLIFITRPKVLGMLRVAGQTIVFSLALMLGGLISLMAGFLPVLGFIMLVVGIVFIIRRFTPRMPAT